MRCTWRALSPELYSSGPDTLVLSPTPGERKKARFELGEEGVSALVVTMDDDRELRFVRQVADG